MNVFQPWKNLFWQGLLLNYYLFISLTKYDSNLNVVNWSFVVSNIQIYIWNVDVVSERTLSSISLIHIKSDSKQIA